MARKLALLLAVLLLLAGWSNPSAAEASAPASETAAPEEVMPAESAAAEPIELEAIVIHGYEWGAAVDAVVLKPNGEVGEYDASTFAVTTYGKARTVTDVFRCDASGNPTEDGACVALKLEALSSSALPIASGGITSHSDWVRAYPVTVALREGAQLTVDGISYDTINCVSRDMLDRRVAPEIDGLNKYAYEELNMAAYEPETLADDGVKNPLIIWLHGAGEGGEDIDIALLGNEVSALLREDVQSRFTSDGGADGAYMLAAQTPTYWMDSGDGQIHDGGDDSIYREMLMAAIEDYVAWNPDVDTNRIYIGGCSNGGYMTMNMLIHYGDYFAAAYPICEAYADAFITDEQIDSLAARNIWFIQSADDMVVNPDAYGVPTYVRLLEAGADNCWYSMFETVRGTDIDQSYSGHFSWVYFFNGQVTAAQDPAAILAGGAEGFVPTNEGGGTVRPQGCADIFDWLNAQTLSEP